MWKFCKKLCKNCVKKLCKRFCKNCTKIFATAYFAKHFALQTTWRGRKIWKYIQTTLPTFKPLIIILTFQQQQQFFPSYFVSIYNISLWQTNCKSLSSSRMQIGLELSRHRHLLRPMRLCCCCCLKWMATHENTNHFSLNTDVLPFIGDCCAEILMNFW